MARAGIYKSEVVKARNNLLSLGRYPSIDAIRSELGNTGSKGTIHRYLKEIEEEEGGSTGSQVVAVSEAIQDLSARLAERLHQEADQRLAALTDKHKAEIATLTDTISALRNEVESFRNQSERQAVELVAEKKAHAENMDALQEQKVVRAQMAQRIQDMEGQQAKEEGYRISLEEKHQHAREALEHFRSAAKEQREQDLRQFEQQIQFLQGELRAAKDGENTKQQELIRSHKDNSRLSSELGHAHAEIHRLESEIRSLSTAQEQLAILNLKKQQVEESFNQAKIQINDLFKANQENIDKLQKFEGKVQRLESALMAEKAAVISYEKIIEKFTPSQVLPTKTDNTKKNNADIQNSLFNSAE